MPSAPRQHVTSFLRRAGRSAAARTGNGERWSEIESAFDYGMWRNRRDDEATISIMLGALSPGGTAIDVGANRGDILEKIVNVAPAGRHVAYEPVPHLAADLVARFPGVDVRNAACSDEQGTAQFTVVVDAPALSGLVQRQDLPPEAQRTERIEVRLDRLDDAIDPELAPQFIKIDVEGAEVKVLQGARELLARHKPVVVFEHGSGGADLYGSTSSELWDVLDEAGMRIFDLAAGGPYTRDAFEAMFTSPLHWNYVAVAA
jgi:FkbM family methyltransferase